MDPMNQLPNMGNLGGPPQPPTVDAKQVLSLPSLFLILLGALGAVEALGSLALLLSGGKTILAILLQALKDLPPEQRKQLEDAIKEGFEGSLSNYAKAFPALGASVFVVFGGLRMRAVRSWGLSLAACIVVMLPLLGCCCCIGLPIGIWGIVMLSKPEVKAQFT